MSSPCAAPSNYVQSETKRRKLRKGTHSCWECKRRKMKCIFNPLSDPTTCNGCRRRGIECVSQEFSEEPLLSTNKTSDGTYDRRAPATPLSTDGRRADHGIAAPVPIIPEPLGYLAFYKSSKHATLQSVTRTSAQQGKYERLSRFLHESLPSREDTEKICTANRHPSVLAHEILTAPYIAGTLDQNGMATPKTLLDIPEPDTQPVLIARHMLLLATLIQQLHPDAQKEIKGLSESLRAIRERLVDLAVSLVTTNDELLGSIEGIECVMIESVYQANIGNLRRSWVSSRRAMSVAQLMGINRSNNQAQFKVLDPKTKYHPSHMWFRIVFLDRYLCLLLGISQGCLDRSMASDELLAKDTPTGRLERIHCVIASRILERNESHPSSRDITLTRTLDVELQRAARSLPSKWWLTPNLEIDSSDSGVLFWNTRRLFAQMLHYNLLNQLHLPYMLRSLSAERKYEYSRITCVNASREMLSRFIALRNFNGIACSCRTVDFLALMAAMTLLLAHLDSYPSEAENLLAHQYHSDRAMIEQVQENMEEVNRLNSDALSAQSADLLRRLVTIEVRTADSHGARKVSVQEPGTEIALPDQDDDVAVSVHIPYFGIIKITRDGMSKEVPKAQATNTTTDSLAQLQVANKSNTISPETLHAGAQTRSSKLSGPSEVPNVEAMTPVDTGYGHVEAPLMMPDTGTETGEQPGTFPILVAGVNDVATHLAPQPLSDLFLHHAEYPGLAAGTDDWAFQGVDLAFFESLMRSDWNEVAD